MRRLLRPEGPRSGEPPVPDAARTLPGVARSDVARTLPGAARSGVIPPGRVAELLMAVYLVVVALIVFWPTAEVATGSVDIISSTLQAVGAPPSVTPGRVELVTNVLLFVPLSFLGSTFRPEWGWRGWLLAGLTGTLAIELTQMLLLPGRSPQVRDVVANTLGALCGYLLVRLLRRT